MSRKRTGWADAPTLRKALLRRVVRRTKASGAINLPAVPALLDHHVETLDRLFSSIGRPFTPEELQKARALLAEKIDWAFSRSHNSWVAVEWSTDPSPKMTLSYTMTGWQRTVGEQYAEWVTEREPPLFGKYPDARVMDLAATLGPPAEAAILDVGAGTGRNSFPLVRRGHPVDALEIAPALVAELEKEVRDSLLPLRVVRGSFFNDAVALPRDRYRMILLAETCSHWRGVPDLVRVFQRMAQLLEPGGVGLFNAFIASPGYQPEAAVREFSQITWCPMYTRKDLDAAREGLPLEPIFDESVIEYEKAHQPADGWPPTSWYVGWCEGRDLFDMPGSLPPFELRWLAYRRT